MTNKIMQVTNSKGILFNVRLIEKGDKYGKDWCLTHKEDRKLVEFYDARQDKDKFTEYGQFVSRYYVITILGEDGWSSNTAETGLDLDGGIDDWFIDKEGMEKVCDWLKQNK